MSAETDPLAARLKAGLGWPSWSTWPSELIEPDTREVLSAPVDHATRRVAIERRRDAIGVPVWGVGTEYDSELEGRSIEHGHFG